jgi:trehalose utilization protein
MTSNSNPIRVLVWDEAPGHADKTMYPNSLNGAIAGALNTLGQGQILAETANLDEPNQGITAENLKLYDVLIWWGHARHGEVSDEVAQIVKNAVHNDGLGFIPLHSGHYSKTYKAVLESTGHLKGGWREIKGFEREEITFARPNIRLRRASKIS